MTNIYNARILIFSFVVLLMFIGCSAGKLVSKSESLPKVDTLSDEQEFDFKYQFFEANKFSLEGNYDLAINLFNNCLKIDPKSAVVHYKLASLYAIIKEYKLAEKHAELSVLNNDDNVWYLYLAGSIYLQNSNFPRAKETFNKLIKLDDTQLDFYLNLADVYLKENDLNGALKIYNDIELKFGISEIISLQKHKLYLASNKKKEALKELENLSKSAPQNIEYKRMIGDFYVQTNSIDEAIFIYSLIIKDYPNDGYSHIGLAECYRKKGEIERSFIELKLAFESDEIPSDVKFNMLLGLIKNAGDNVSTQQAIFDLTFSLVEIYPNDADLLTIYANFLLQKNQLKEAREVLVKVVSMRKDKYPVWEQLVLLDNQFSDWDTMYIHTSEALLYFPNQSFLYFFNGFSAFQLEKFQEAIKSLSFGNKLITKDDPLALDYLTFLGESYYKIEDKEASYGFFDKIIEADPDNIMVLNNYAYYLSLDNIELDRAEKMSKKTIIMQPENPTYLDTYAWILFKLKKNEEALFYIEKAIANDSLPSDVVLEHYGDILFHNGRVDSALAQWIKAQEKGVGSGLLDKKILNKTYFEK